MPRWTLETMPPDPDREIGEDVHGRPCIEFAHGTEDYELDTSGGEFQAMTDAERRQVNRLVLDYLRDRRPETLDQFDKLAARIMERGGFPPGLAGI